MRSDCEIAAPPEGRRGGHDCNSHRRADESGRSTARDGVTTPTWWGGSVVTPIPTSFSALFGDNIAFRADTYGVDMAGLRFLRLMVSHVGPGLPGWERGIRSAAFLLTARNQLANLISSHCTSAGVLSDRIGLDRQLRRARHIFERWDGRGMPNGARGEDIPLEIHIVHLSDVIEVHLRTGGLAQAVEVARSRRGTQFSPAVADVFERDAAALIEGLLEIDVWTAALAAGTGS